MDPAILKASCDAMTKYAREGKDAQFGKDPYYLREVATGPFYVVRGKLNTLTSLNGVRVNADLQVLTKEGHVSRASTRSVMTRAACTAIRTTSRSAKAPLRPLPLTRAAWP